MGVAALVLGIIGTVFALIPVWSLVAIPISVVALILGVVGRKAAVTNQQSTGTPTAGLVLGIVGLVLSVAMWVMCSLVLGGVAKGFDKALNDPEFQKKLNDPNLNKEFNDTFKKAIEEAAKKQPPEGK